MILIPLLICVEHKKGTNCNFENLEGHSDSFPKLWRRQRSNIEVVFQDTQNIFLGKLHHLAPKKSQGRQGQGKPVETFPLTSVKFASNQKQEISSS